MRIRSHSSERWQVRILTVSQDERPLAWTNKLSSQRQFTREAHVRGLGRKFHQYDMTVPPAPDEPVPARAMHRQTDRLHSRYCLGPMLRYRALRMHQSFTRACRCCW